MWIEQQQRVEALPSLESLLEVVAGHYNINVQLLCHPNKSRKISQARALACFIAQRLLGYSGVRIARALNISPSGVSIAARRGEAIVKEEDAKDLVSNIKISTTSP